MTRILANLLIGSTFVLIAAASCRKDYNSTPNPVPPPPSGRSVKYILYTEQDFRGENDTITFSLRMGTQDSVIYDSSLAPMRVSEIPDKMHEITIDKQVPHGHDKDTLTVGWVYYIRHVGISWYFDTLSPTTMQKRIEYSFR